VYLLAWWLFGADAVTAYGRAHWLELAILAGVVHIARRLEWLEDQIWDLGEPLREQAEAEGEVRRAMREM